MKIHRVVGKITLSKVHPTLLGKSLVLARPAKLSDLLTRHTPDAEELIVVNDVNAGEGDWIGVADGAEAAAPFYPSKRPVDAYVAMIFDNFIIDENVASQYQ